MKTPALLLKARHALARAVAQSNKDVQAARLARLRARTGKMQLKLARKTAKLTKKAARQAELKARDSFKWLEEAQNRLEKVEKKLAKLLAQHKSAAPRLVRKVKVRRTITAPARPKSPKKVSRETHPTVIHAQRPAVSTISSLAALEQLQPDPPRSFSPGDSASASAPG